MKKVTRFHFAASLSIVSALTSCAAQTQAEDKRSATNTAKESQGPQGTGLTAAEVNSATNKQITQTTFTDYNLQTAQAGVKDAAGNSFLLTLSPAQDPSQIQGDKKFLQFLAGPNLHGSIYPVVLQAGAFTQKSLQLYAPFVKAESFPPWKTSDTPIFATYSDQTVQIGAYAPWTSDTWNPNYDFPNLCTGEFASICSLEFVTSSSADFSSANPFAAWTTDDYDVTVHLHIQFGTQNVVFNFRANN